MSKSKNILFLNTGVVWGGVEGWHYKTASALRERGYNIFIAATRGTPFYNKCKTAHFQLKDIPKIKDHTFINPVRVYELLRYIKSEEIDTIFFCQSSHFKYGSVAAKLAGVEKIIYRRALASAINNRFYNRLLLQRCVSDFIAISEITKKESIKKLPDYSLPDDKIKLIYNGIKIDDFANPEIKSDIRKEFGIKSNELLIANIGRLCHQKGQTYLLQALPGVIKEIDNFKVLIIGQGDYEERLKEEARELKIEHRVIFTGFRNDISSILGQIDFLVHTALYEGCPWIILEAMTAGVPIVATDSTSLPEFISDGKNGYLARDKNPEDIAKKIIKMANNNFREELGQKAAEIASNRFSFKKMIDQLEDKLLLK